MSKEYKFFLYMLERYAERNGETADLTMARLKAYDLYDYAVAMYEIYHVEALENAFDDLDRKIAERTLNRNNRDEGRAFSHS